MVQLCVWQQNYDFLSFFLCVTPLDIYNFPETVFWFSTVLSKHHIKRAAAISFSELLLPEMKGHKSCSILSC